ncbi:hypothetical protein GIB67_029319 [Kingdonia uniflora]|uniref:Uncharacterized protein n=1 Tax=Kingdonia uniflora TaxID=39325 RepID=A0A7J7N8Y3_9MAGN|nr:hypothetical protein GIB67_029319 [Kingdonia uniflora]
MKLIAGYLLTVLRGNNSPTVDIKHIRESVGAETDDDDDKIESGWEKLALVPFGGGGAIAVDLNGKNVFEQKQFCSNRNLKTFMSSSDSPGSEGEGDSPSIGGEEKHK